MVAFRKNQYAVSAIDALARISEALEKRRLSRQGKQIQQRRARNPLHAIVNSCQEIPPCGRSSQGFERFAPSCRRQPMSQARRQRGLNEADIHVIDVVAHHQHRTVHAGKVLAPFYLRPAQQHHGRPHQQVVRAHPDPPHRPAQSPTRIVILRATNALAAEHLFQIAHRARRAEAGLA